MQRIAQANIDRFTRLLKTDTDPAKRAVILQLLAEERDRLDAMLSPDRRNRKNRPDTPGR